MPASVSPLLGDDVTGRLSNTAHANYMPASLSVAAGVDTLVLSVRGELADSFVSRLEVLQAAAKLANEAVASPWSFGGATLVMLPHGRKSWRYVLRNDYADVQLVRGGVSGVCASLRLSALSLWTVGVDLAAIDAERFIYERLGRDLQVMVSEVHICRDVAGRDVAADWSDIRADLVKRATSVMVVDKHNQAQTVAIGARSGAISAVLYDKLAESHVSHKEWMRSIWASSGWNGESPVWRLEFRLRRDFLRSVGIHTVDDLLSKLGGCWRYATRDWLRHIDRGSHGDNVSRADLSAWWLSYAADLEEDMPVCAVARELQSHAEADELVSQAAGCLIGAAYKLQELPEDMAVRVVERVYKMAARLGSDWESALLRRGLRYQLRR